ncbi:unnamed protein product [Gordionus sp. m RMFG-2023]
MSFWEFNLDAPLNHPNSNLNNDQTTEILNDDNKREEESDKMRFQIELEFIQCLSNPNYLNFLAQHGYFKDEKFLNYLKYLEYWKTPQYSHFLRYPQCLFFLELLQEKNFQKEIANTQCAKFIEDQLILQWQHYKLRKNKLFKKYETSNNV